MANQDYLSEVLDLSARAARDERPNIDRAVDRIADAIASGGKWWVFGTGHSHTLVEELWGRAGGMIDVHPILEPSLMLHEGLTKSSLLERLPGLASVLAELHPISEGDVLLTISNSGRNAVPVELAMIAKERGATVVALTSLAHSSTVPSRAPSGLKLFEVADIIIDNHGVPGDAVVPRRGGSVGATSTVVGAMLLQALSVGVVKRLDERGAAVAVYESLNA